MFPREFGTNFIFLSIETRDTTQIEDIKMIALAVHGMKPYARCVSTALVFRLGPGAGLYSGMVRVIHLPGSNNATRVCFHSCQVETWWLGIGIPGSLEMTVCVETWSRAIEGEYSPRWCHFLCSMFLLSRTSVPEVPRFCLFWMAHALSHL